MTDQELQAIRIDPNVSYSDREAAQIVLRDRCMPTSWKYIQAAIRAGHLKGQKVAGVYCILGKSLMDYLSFRKGRAA